jgi:hypothetical protein
MCGWVWGDNYWTNETWYEKFGILINTPTLSAQLHRATVRKGYVRQRPHQDAGHKYVQLQSRIWTFYSVYRNVRAQNVRRQRSAAESCSQMNRFRRGTTVRCGQRATLVNPLKKNTTTMGVQRFWKRATTLVVGWFAGHRSKNHRMWYKKGKAIPLQAWRGPEDSRRLRLPDFKTIGTWRW